MCGEEVPALYDPETDRIEIYLPVINKFYRGDKIIEALVKIINHEVMHYVFKKLLGEPTPKRVEIEHKVMRSMGID